MSISGLLSISTSVMQTSFDNIRLHSIFKRSYFQNACLYKEKSQNQFCRNLQELLVQIYFCQKFDGFRDFFIKLFLLTLTFRSALRTTRIDWTFDILCKLAWCYAKNLVGQKFFMKMRSAYLTGIYIYVYVRIPLF